MLIGFVDDDSFRAQAQTGRTGLGLSYHTHPQTQTHAHGDGFPVTVNTKQRCSRVQGVAPLSIKEPAPPQSRSPPPAHGYQEGEGEED